MKNSLGQGINIYRTNDIILGIINHVYHIHCLLVNLFFLAVDFYLSHNCQIHVTTSNQTVWPTDNIKNQQLKYYFRLIQNGQGFCPGKYKERGKVFASNILDVIQFRGETVDSQTTNGQDSH